MIIVWLVGGLYAFYLSWRCNSNHGFGAISKVFFGIFSFLGSWSYLLSYLFFKSWTCNPKASLDAMRQGHEAFADF
jgi:hypothetical protein